MDVDGTDMDFDDNMDDDSDSNLELAPQAQVGTDAGSYNSYHHIGLNIVLGLAQSHSDACWLWTCR
jgi:hypothetical protein